MIKKKKKGRIVNGILLGTCILSAVAALLLGGETVKEGWEYDDLAKDAATQTADGIDWDALRSRNPDIAAWLRVDGTGIDLPVVSTRKGDPADFYLNHDFNRNLSFAGCPYLDARSTADGPHALVYGHHMGFTGQIFSPIFATYRQSEFDKIGEMSWFTPDKGRQTLKPIMAMSVDKKYQPIQTFSFSSAQEVRAWLSNMKKDATAVSSDCDEMIASATRAITLVTCSTMDTGGRARTLLVFAQ